MAPHRQPGTLYVGQSAWASTARVWCSVGQFRLLVTGHQTPAPVTSGPHCGAGESLPPLRHHTLSQAGPTGSQAQREEGVASCGNHTVSQQLTRSAPPSAEQLAWNQLSSSSSALLPQMADWGDVCTYFFILQKVWVWGSTYSPLRLP